MFSKLKNIKESESFQSFTDSVAGSLPEVEVSLESNEELKDPITKINAQIMREVLQKKWDELEETGSCKHKDKKKREKSSLSRK